MSLDAANAAYLERMRLRGLPNVQDVPLPDYRAMLAASQRTRAPGPPVGRVEDLPLATSSGRLPLRLYIPEHTPLGAMVYLHGGGWTVGDIQGWDPLCRRLANGTGCAVVSVGYRLAPEHPFPAALEDAIAALGWAAGELPVRLGLPLAPLVAGDSAGANLAAAAAMVLRDHGRGPDLAMQILAYPVVDADASIRSVTEFVPPRLSRDELAWYVRQYVPRTERPDDPRISPIRAENLAGLPPTFILTAENDILRGQGEAYAAALLGAGVPVAARRYLGTMHGFLTIGDEISQGLEAVGDIAAFVKYTLARRVAPR